jgi:hypothetical protein
LYFSFVFFIILGKISLTKVRFNGKLKKDFCFKTSILKNGTSTKDNGTSSLTMNNAKSFLNCFGEDHFWNKAQHHQKRKK